MLKILIVAILIGMFFIISHEPLEEQGAGLGHHGDYVKFDKEGNFIGVEQR